jgi:glycerol-3-phosphate dehydrogenase
MDRPACDVVVVGGGVTGTAIARDLALRGVEVLLLEREDWGAGASACDSTFEALPAGAGVTAETVRPAALEAAVLQAIAPHLVERRIVLFLALPEDAEALKRIDAELEALDRLRSPGPFQPRLRLSGLEARRLEPGLSPAVAAAVAAEDWTLDAQRLAWLNALDATRAGAQALIHCRVEAILSQGGVVAGVRYRAPDGRRVEVAAHVVVNAAGPWVGEVAAMAGIELRPRLIKHLEIVYDRCLTPFGLAALAADGRWVALAPRGATGVLGAVESETYARPEVLEATGDELDDLRRALGRVLPGIGQGRALRSRIAAFPCTAPWGVPPRLIRPRLVVVDHGPEGAPGLVSAMGGGLLTHRAEAEAAADLVCSRLGVHARSVTARRPLPGGAGDAPPAEELAREHGLTALAAARLLRRHGGEALQVLEDPCRGRLVCRCEAITEAELLHATRHEQVRTLGDAARRLGLATGACAGTACLERAAAVMARELGWSAAQRSQAWRDHAAAVWRTRAPVLGRWGWAQEELAYGARRGWPGGLWP